MKSNKIFHVTIRIVELDMSQTTFSKRLEKGKIIDEVGMTMQGVNHSAILFAKDIIDNLFWMIQRSWNKMTGQDVGVTKKYSSQLLINQPLLNWRGFLFCLFPDTLAKLTQLLWGIENLGG